MPKFNFLRKIRFLFKHGFWPGEEQIRKLEKFYELQNPMHNKLLRTRPDRLTIWDLGVLRANPTLRDSYNRRWNVAFF